MRAKRMKLNVIEYDAEEIVERFIVIKREPTKTHLSHIKTDITHADSQYQDCGEKNLLKTMTPITLNTPQKDSLKKCYKNKTTLIDLIINEIRSAQDVFHDMYCPFCGFHNPIEIDHYLPIAEFPEFSFIPINLIPICPKCNKAKSNSWIENDERLFLNKYFDDDNLDEFLKCKPQIIDENNITFEYCLDYVKLARISKGDIIKTHYEKLNIMTIYKDNSNGIMSELDASLCAFKGNLHNLKKTIKIHYEHYRDNYGLNFYKTVTYKTIFETDDVLQWYYDRMPDENKY